MAVARNVSLTVLCWSLSSLALCAGLIGIVYLARYQPYAKVRNPFPPPSVAQKQQFTTFQAQEEYSCLILSYEEGEANCDVVILTKLCDVNIWTVLVEPVTITSSNATNDKPEISVVVGPRHHYVYLNPSLLETERLDYPVNTSKSCWFRDEDLVDPEDAAESLYLHAGNWETMLPYTNLWFILTWISWPVFVFFTALSFVFLYRTRVAMQERFLRL